LGVRRLIDRETVFFFQIVPCEKCGETFTNDDYNQDYVDYDSSYSDYRRKRDADECSDCQDHGERFNLVSEKSKLVIKDKDIKNYLEDEARDHELINWSHR
jgi:hypothetical protein